jgi:large subunit ribosomal protein L13
MQRKTHTIDATGQVLGRLATHIVTLLRGKHRPDFAPHKDEGDFVIVMHSDKIKLTGKKIEQKIYYHHSGYLGGLKGTPVKKLLNERPTEVIRKAVYGMLPKNKLRAKQIIRLKFK